MPVQYGSILEEHRAVRERVGLFDLSHMGELFVEGPEAGAALAAALVTDPPRLAVGRAHYSMICAPDGGIIDDLIVYRAGRGALPRRRQRRQRRDRLRRARRAARRASRPILDDRSLATGLVAVQGPRAAEVLAPLTDVDLAALRYYAIAEGTVAGHPGARRPDRLHRRGRLRGLRRHDRRPSAVGRPARRRPARRRRVPVGLGARDTLRLEAGMPLYGNELDRDTNPYEAGLGRVVKLDKAGDFVGRAALEKVARDGPGAAARRPDRRGPRDRPPRLPGLAGERRTGVVTSGTQSPTLGVPIAMAYVAPADARAGYHGRGRDPRRPRPGRVVALPFYRREA